MQNLRKKIAIILEPGQENSPAGKWLDLFLIILIILNVLAVILESIDGVFLKYHMQLWSFEVFSVSIFTIEYLLRLWTCVEFHPAGLATPWKTRLRWMVSPLGLIDLLAILPFYIQIFYAHPGPDNWLLLRALRGLRLLRIFKLARFSPALRVLTKVLKEESSTLAVAGFILFMVVILASWGIYELERIAQPEYFPDIPAAMWWTIITITTVGYGDVVPITLGGKILAGFISLIGIGMLALPAGILASGFSAEFRNRDEDYEHQLETLLEDGKLSIHDAKELEFLRERLGLSENRARSLLKTATRNRHRHTHQTCPHCGEDLNKPVDTETKD